MDQKVSIITVVFNNVEKIEKTIQNVLRQTYQNLEYIVVDGASTDGTIDVIRKYDKQLKWISEPDNGIYDAMMKGVKLATGEWVLFRNCGDYFCKPSSIKDLFDIYEKDLGEDFLLADSCLFRSWGYKNCKPSILNSSFYDSMPVMHPSTFVRRSTQLKYPFHLEYKNSADYCFFVETLLEGAKWKYFNLIISYVESDVGVTAFHYDRTLAENLDFLKKYGAPETRINQLEKYYKSVRIKSSFYKYIPFLEQYRKIKMLRNGWVQANIDRLLDEV